MAVGPVAVLFLKRLGGDLRTTLAIVVGIQTGSKGSRSDQNNASITWFSGVNYLRCGGMAVLEGVSPHELQPRASGSNPAVASLSDCKSVLSAEFQ